MNCRKCNAELSPEVVAETTRVIRTTCEAIGIDALAVETMVNDVTPLCQKCLDAWAAGGDDLTGADSM
jgi:hypothetical protein